MPKEFIRIIILSAVLTNTLSACSSDGWFGAKDKDSELLGERHAVLGTAPEIKVDSAAAAMPFTLPEQVENSQWSRTQGYQSEESPNLALGSNIAPAATTKVSGIEGDYPTGSGPIIAEKKLFILGNKGTVVAYDTHNLRKPLWQYKITIDNEKDRHELFSDAGMAYQEGVLYVVTGFNSILALKTTDGSVLWKRKVNSIARSAPAVSKDSVFVNTIDNHLYALNAKDGAILWTHSGVGTELGVLGAGSPFVKGNVLVIPYSSGEIYALNANNGSTLWSENLASNKSAYSSLSDIDVSPVNYQNFIITSSYGGMVAAFDVRSGGRVWQQEISTKFSPWVAGDYGYFINNESQILSVYLPTGVVRWVTQLPAYKNQEDKTKPYHWTSPILAGNQLWVVGSHGQLISIAPENGKITSERKVMKDILVAPVVAESKMFLFSRFGRLLELK